ncbi:hypothetical protein Egran_00360 [Elaphomyces granulatus]|uniref:Major facilitator superfamily (MFS) profile domain-containing protein n=1 Tax=Elaphomyces granulatus TaxID=519963 RepID=A0A232M668_9EURO|nr:hypothetical protein Egran_00360 [Elaphomyces granulatus]
MSDNVIQRLRQLRDYKYHTIGDQEATIIDDENEILVRVDGEPKINRLALAQRMKPDAFASVEKSLVRKLDIRLLAGTLQNNIAAAKVAGIQESLHLHSTQYAASISILFVGYISMQIPSNMFLTLLRPSIYLPCIMAIWGVLSTLTGIVQNAGGLYVTRFFLGIFEAAFYPGALFLISSWYKRSELGVRSAILYSGSQLGGASSGLIGATIQHSLDGAFGIESWRWIFLIEGSITVFVAFCAIFILPDYPSTTRWLSSTERAVAEWRLVNDVGQLDEDDGKWKYGFKMAFKDWRLYIFAITFLCIQVATATSNYFPSVVQTLGFSRVITLLLTVPPNVISMIVSIANNYSADLLQNSSFHVVWPLVVAIMGFILGATSVQTSVRYFAMILMISGGHSSNAVLLAWTQKAMQRPRIKRAAAVAFVNAFGNIAHVFAAFFYPDEAKPRYLMAMFANSVFAIAAILFSLFLRFTLIAANKALDSGLVPVGEVMLGESQTEICGITEEERHTRKHSFRYIT